MVSFAVVTPSRGLVHSRTVEAVMSNVWAAPDPASFRGWVLTHDLPIPDCHEAVAERGLAAGADALWFVEEDTVPPPNALRESMALLDTYDVVAVDYPVGGEAWACVTHDKAGEIAYCGLGSTLIRREVFEALPRPWFSTEWVYIGDRNGWKPIPNKALPEQRYGHQDIHFAMQVRAAGFRIGQVAGMLAAHAKLVELGAAQTNHGAHRIDVATEILRYPS